MPSQAGSIHARTRPGFVRIIATLAALILALTVTVLALAATDNSPVLASLSIDDVSVVEGASGAVEAIFTVALSMTSTETVSVEYATADDTANAPTDYTAIATTTLTFAPGETTQTVTITVNGDNTAETDETFFVNLANAGNATIADGQGVGTITSDDSLPSLSITDVSALEGHSSKSNVAFTVTLSAASDQQVTVDYASANGTATWPSDYFRIRQTTLTFPPGTITQIITAQIKGDTLYESDETFFVNLFNATNATIADAQAVGAILNDDPEPTVQFSAATYSVNENAGAATIEVTLSSPSEVPATVSVASSDGTASSLSDYAPVSTTLTFDPQVTTILFTVPITDDAILEGDEALLLTLSNPVSATLGSPNPATLTIVDDDGQSTIQFSAAAYNVNEGAGSATITATLTGATALTATVSYATSDGTALASSDYTASSGTLTFAPGVTSQTFSVPIVNDTVFEGNESLILTLSNAVGATLGSPNPATLTIVDDDGQSTIQFSAAAYSVNEGAGSATITATLTGATAVTATVSYATSDGMALAGSDYTASSGTLTFAPGVTSQTFSVPITNDTVFEGNESLILTLSNAVGATLGSPNPATLTIMDNDTQPTVQFSAAAYSVNEGAGSATITATLTGATAVTATVSYATSDGTALAGSDYTASSGTLTFAPGTTTRTFSVAIIGDTVLEENETLVVTLSNPVGATLGSPNPAILTILDDDSQPTIQFSAATYSVNESAGSATITVTLTGSTSTTATVSYATSNGMALAGSDYTASSGALTFAPGATNRTFSVPITNDTIFESNESLVLTLNNPVSATLGSPNPATLTIVDNDAPPTVQFSAATYSVSEGAGSATITATLTGATAVTATVSYATSNGTALAGSDYAATSGTLTFAPGVTSRTFGVPIINNTVFEANESLSLALSNPVSATLGSPNPTALTIVDNDAPPTVRFSATTYSVSEGAGSATITATLTGATALTATVSYATSDGTALAGSDYTASSGTLIFAPGVTSRTFSVPIINDTVFEANESVALTLSNPVSATLGSPNLATLTILDDDGPPTVQFSSATYSVNESAGSATIVASLSKASAFTVTVSYATSNGTALADGDYTATSGTLTFAPGTTARTFDVAIIGDALDEVDETITLTLSTPSGNATLGAPNPATLIIVDDDGVPTVRFHTGAYSVSENAGPAMIIATLSNESAFTVTIQVATRDGTASSAADYAPVSRMLSFAPETTAIAFSVPITDDTFFEGNETLTLTLSNPVSATLGLPNPVALTIVEDETQPTVQFGAATYSIAENAGPAVITATLSTPSAFTATVNIATSDSTASSADDYVAVASRLALAPGATRVSFTVPITDDVLEEPNETVTLALSVPNNATLGTPNSATLTILDNDNRLRLYLPLIARTSAGGPNLVPISFKVSPAAPIVSQTTTFTVVIQNQGTTAISKGFWVDLYIDPVRPPAEANETWDQLCAKPLPDCYGGAWLITRTLAPGQLITLTSAALHPDFDYWPDRFVTSGSHAVYVYVDSYGPSSPSGAIEETNESDNRADLIVQVAPDLLQLQAEPPPQLTTSLRPDRVLKAIEQKKRVRRTIREPDLAASEPGDLATVLDTRSKGTRGNP